MFVCLVIRTVARSSGRNAAAPEFFGKSTFNDIRIDVWLMLIIAAVGNYESVLKIF